MPASVVSQQDQYLMSRPANHMSSSGREAFLVQGATVRWSEVYHLDSIVELTVELS